MVQVEVQVEASGRRGNTNYTNSHEIDVGLIRG